jgi:hypothetical protein
LQLLDLGGCGQIQQRHTNGSRNVCEAFAYGDYTIGSPEVGFGACHSDNHRHDALASYVPPLPFVQRILSRPYGVASDWWGVGLLLLSLLIKRRVVDEDDILSAREAAAEIPEGTYEERLAGYRSKMIVVIEEDLTYARKLIGCVEEPPELAPLLDRIRTYLMWDGDERMRAVSAMYPDIYPSDQLSDRYLTQYEGEDGLMG